MLIWFGWSFLVWAGEGSLVIGAGFSVFSTASIIMAAFKALVGAVLASGGAAWPSACLVSFCCFLGNAVELIFIDRVQRAALRDGKFAVHRLADEGVAGEAEEQILGAPLHCGKLGEAGLELGLIEAGGVELLVEPFIKAHCPGGFKVTRPWSEGEAIQGVENAVVSLQLGGLIAGSCLGVAGVLSWLVGGRRSCLSPSRRG